MTNGDTLKIVRERLESGKLPPDEAQILTLTLVLDMAESTAYVKKKSIGVWIDQNRPVAIFIAFLIVTLMEVAPDVFFPWIAKALGLP